MSKSLFILQKWIICGPEISRIVTEFEVFHLRSKTNNYSHHREGNSYPKKFHNKVLRFMQTMEEYGNHFSCYFEELYVLGTGYFAEAVKTLYSKKTLGHDQYFKFIKMYLQMVVVVFTLLKFLKLTQRKLVKHHSKSST